MKSILFYFNSIQPSGGIERVIVTLANKISHKYNVTILVKDEPKSFYNLNDNISIVSLNNKLRLNMNSQLSRIYSITASLLKGTKILKHYLSHNTFDYYYLAHPLNVLEFHLSYGITNKNIVITEHGASSAYNYFYKRIKSWLYPKAKFYVVPTKTDTKYYESLGYPSVYLPHFKSDLPYVKTNLENQIALSIGRFTEEKQQMVLSRLWKTLVNEKGVKSWKLFLVGNGELYSQYVNYITEHNLQDYVNLLPPRKDVEFYYKQASIFLLTSRSEGFGMVLLEATSFGIPCISFDCPTGPRDIIVDKENGYLIAHNDEKKFENAVLKCIKSKSIIYEMSEKAIQISKYWNEEKLLNQWYTIFN